MFFFVWFIDYLQQCDSAMAGDGVSCCMPVVVKPSSRVRTSGAAAALLFITYLQC